MKILLVQPNYYTKYPPLPLLKIATYHKQKGNEVELVYGNNMYAKGDVIDITSLFTYEWKPVHNSVDFYKKTNPGSQINLGGIYTTLLPEHATKTGAKIYRGLIKDCEDLVPDYSLVPEWTESIIHSSRGCVRKCEFCAVKDVEPEFTYRSSIKQFVIPEHKQITFFDNNFLANPKCMDIIQELISFNKIVDFNQGLDIRLLNEEKAIELSKLNIQPVRFAFDSIEYKDKFIKGIELANEYKLGKKSWIMTYMLYNFTDTPEDLLQRLKICGELGVHVYLMKYAPIYEPDKEYIGKHWTAEKLEYIERLKKILNTKGNINIAGGYTYVKIPMIDYVKNIDALWKYEAASSGTGKQRELFGQND